MSMMLEWAEEEIRRAKEEEDKYATECLDSALRAFKSLMKDGHTGYSLAFTTEIIKRLLERKPLSSITDSPENWVKVQLFENSTLYQCERMPSLFKTEYANGEVKYNDCERVYVVDIQTGDTFASREGQEIVNELYPIEMPYYPPLGYFKIYTDGLFYKYLIEPGGKKVTLDMEVKEK